MDGAALCSTVGCGETCSGVDVRWMCEVEVEVEVEADGGGGDAVMGMPRSMCSV